MVELEFESPEGVIDATLHRRDVGQVCPGVLMLPDIRGPRAEFLQMADRLALAGYAVVLPNVYYRLGHAPVPDLSAPFPDPETMAALLKLKATLTPERVRTDMRALFEGMAAHPAIATGKMGVVGYCMSGSFALRAAAACPDLVGVAASYHGGNLVTRDGESPHFLAERIEAEIYCGHATNDPQMPPEHIVALNEELTSAGVRFRCDVYPGGHGFAVPGPRYHAESDAQHWESLLDLLSRLPMA